MCVRIYFKISIINLFRNIVIQNRNPKICNIITYYCVIKHHDSTTDATLALIRV